MNRDSEAVPAELAAHFRGRDPSMYRLYGELLARARRYGPVTVLPEKTRITFRAPECPTTWMIRLPGWPGRPAPPESDRRGWAMAPPAEGRDVHCGGRSFEPFATDGVDDRWRVVCARRL